MRGFMTVLADPLSSSYPGLPETSIYIQRLIGGINFLLRLASSEAISRTIPIRPKCLSEFYQKFR
jgi:hypothetical protein